MVLFYYNLIFSSISVVGCISMKNTVEIQWYWCVSTVLSTLRSQPDETLRRLAFHNIACEGSSYKPNEKETKSVITCPYTGLDIREVD